MYNFFTDPEYDLFWANNAYGFIYPEEPPSYTRSKQNRLSVDEVRKQAKENKDNDGFYITVTYGCKCGFTRGTDPRYFHYKCPICNTLCEPLDESIIDVPNLAEE